LGSRVTFPQDSHGTEIEITNVEVEDAGKYECSATNEVSPGVPSRVVTRVIELDVHCTLRGAFFGYLGNVLYVHYWVIYQSQEIKFR